MATSNPQEDKLIDVFNNNQLKNKGIDYDCMNYINNWSLLMQVVEKIKEISQTSKEETKTKLLHYQRNNKTIFDLYILENIEVVYKKVIEFILFFNNNLLSINDN